MPSIILFEEGGRQANIVVFIQRMKQYNMDFFYCSCAKFLWRIVFVTFGLQPSFNVARLFLAKWSRQNDKAQSLVGVVLDAGLYGYEGHRV